MKRDAILRILREHRAELERRGVKSIRLFGSTARDEATETSDVDLLVEFSVPVGLFEFVGVKSALESLLGIRVDLATPDALRYQMRDAILQEAINA